MEENHIEYKIGTGKVLLVLVIAILIPVITQGIANLIAIPIPEVISPIIYAIVSVGLAYLGFKLLSEKVMNLSLRQCRINKSNIQLKWLIYAFILSVLVMAILLFIPGEFNHQDVEIIHVIKTVITAVFVLGIGAGFVEEMVYRGIIMKVVEKRWGKAVAVLVPSMIFGLLHAIEPSLNLIDILMLFVGGTSVGIMFSLIVYKSESVWNSAIVHAVWNVLVIGDILHIGTTHNESAIFSYKLLSNSVLLTGGNFGIEVSIISILGYLSVIALILFSMRKKRNL